MEWEIFAVYVISAEDYFVMTSFKNEQEYCDFVAEIKSVALLWRDYDPKPEDYMLTLNTCSFEFKDAHTLIHAKLIKKSDNLKK